MSPEFQYDVFLSHNKADKPRVRRLAGRLRAAGLRVWFDEWNVQPGDDIYLAIERGLETSRTLVLCLSQAALDSAWVNLERSTVLFRDPANSGRRFVPLLLADCRLPDALRRYKYVDYRNEGATAWKELLSMSVASKPPLLLGNPGVRRFESAQEGPFKSAMASKPWVGMLKHTYRWLLHDQIRESGGWGTAQRSVMRRIQARRMSPLEEREGGVISTFMALRALRSFEQNRSSRRNSHTTAALNYLLRRQTKKGGFGRFIESPSGREIHASIRHTAFAVLSLLDLNGPPRAISSGMGYLSTHCNADSMLDDAAPSLAIAGMLHVFDRFLASQDYLELLTQDEIDRLRLAEWPKTRRMLLRELMNLSKATSFSPLFPPYGNHELMAFDTALTTIDFISQPLDGMLAPLAADVLSRILASRINGAIPYGRGLDSPDVGMSAYFLSIITRQGFLENLGDSALVRKLLNAAAKVMEFLVKCHRQRNYRKYTYCDTLANLLLTHVAKEQKE
jgi:hypothetical protein